MTNRFRTEIIGDATLILGDCREILPTLGKVDAVVTDPPYLLTRGSRCELESQRGSYHQNFLWRFGYNNDGNLVVCVPIHEWLPLIQKNDVDTVDFYIMSNDKNLGATIAEMEKAGLKIHNILVWHKDVSVANRWYFKNCEFTVYGWTGLAKTIRKPSSAQYFKSPVDARGDHPTQKPTALMAHYVTNSTDVSGLVLDPFMGSGTTGVACVQMGRKFIGIEIEPKYFDIACRRIEEAWKQPRLFEEQRAKPVQENLLGGLDD